MIKACIQPYRGAPAIWINGEPVEPFMLFGRLEMDNAALLDVFYREIERAARSGVHIHTFFVHLDPDMTAPDTASNRRTRALMRRILETDPEGYLLPRVLPPYDHLATDTPESENERFSDGGDKKEDEPCVRADFVSDMWREQIMTLLARFIRMVLADPVLSKRTIGYHFSGGETGEWFQRRYWDGVLNVSEANTRAFRRWLAAKYATDETLSAAWGREVRLADVCVPADLPGYAHEPFEKGLFEGAADRRFVDYLDYYSDEVASLIEQGAATVKRETGGNSLYVSFYGYHFEIPGAYSGHMSLARVLRCPDVDVLTSPVSYVNRNERGQGAYMNEVGSVLAAGKYWLDESDYRAPVGTLPPPCPNTTPGIKTRPAARQVILRECGKLALHGAGTWWMDLFNHGWWDDDTLWADIADGRRFYDEMRANARPAAPEVCYLIDEKAMSLVGDTWRFALDLLGKTRDEAYFTGLSYDLRLVEDFLEGRVDGAKLYVFVNPFRLHERGLTAIAERLRANGASALWMFGFGADADADELRAATGFGFTVTRESADAVMLADGTRLSRVPVTPLTVPDGVTLGGYPDGRAAFAKSDAAGYPSWFCGGTRAGGELVRRVAEAAGARLYTAGDNFNRLGDLALLHTVSAGTKRVDFGCPARELCKGHVYPDGVASFEAGAGETFLFILNS